MTAFTVDEYMKNEGWVARMNRSFGSIDIDKKGYVEERDWMKMVDNIERDVKPDQKLIDNLKKAVMIHVTAIGADTGKKLTQEQYVMAMAQLGAAETSRLSKGEKRLGEDVENAWFDVIDTTHDGFVTLEGFKAIMTACNAPAAVPEAMFNKIDTNKTGKVERKKLSEYQLKFLFDLNMYQ